MKKLAAILIALSCSAQAQINLTVTADTNRVIRTNFSLVRSQITDLSSATFAISNVTSLQGALDAKLATNGDAFALTNFPAALLRTNGSAAALTNFPALLLTTNSAESAFPAALLRTNGDGGGLTNLPNANLSNATGILPLLNGGTGATNASGARTALELGTAATNADTAFQPANTNLTALAGGDGSSLTNVTITDASSLTNFPSDLLRTNGSAGALTNFPAELLRTNGDGGGLSNVSVDLTTVLPPYAGNAGKVLAVNTNETDVEFTAISNTVTDASTLTNFPAIILQTNSADGSFPEFLLRTNGSAGALTNFPTFNQNTTGTASNVTGVVAIANGGSGQTTAATAIEAFLPIYSGNADRILALNSNATALLWTTNTGGGLPETPLAISNGGTAASDASNALTNLTILRSNNTVAVGTSVDTKGVSNSIFIGALASADATNDHGSTVIGYQAESRGLNSVALGINALVGFNNSIQIGVGTNMFSSNTVQFFTWGTVNQSEWGYLASASAAGGLIMTSSTAAVQRTNLKLPLDALTNASSVTMMRALAGSTNTSEPFSGTISVVGTNNTNTLVFSNGILTSVTTP